MQSEMMMPPKPSFSRRRPVMMRRDMVAGMCSGSICGKRMWVVITAGAPASMPAINGFSSRCISSSKLRSMQGRPRWESTGRIAMAGEMLERAVDAAVQQAAHHLAAVFGHTLRRIAVAAHADDGLSGLQLMSMTGARLKSTPQLRSSWAVSRPHIVGVAGVAGGGYRHGAGDVDLTFRQAGDNAALLVDGDEGRHAGFFLHHFAQGGARAFSAGGHPGYCGGKG